MENNDSVSYELCLSRWNQPMPFEKLSPAIEQFIKECAQHDAGKIELFEVRTIGQWKRRYTIGLLNI